MSNLIDINILMFIKMVAEEKYKIKNLKISNFRRNKNNLLICNTCTRILSKEYISYIENYLLEFIKCSRCQSIINFLPKPMYIEMILEELDKSSKLDDIGKYKLLACIDSIAFFSTGKRIYYTDNKIKEHFYNQQIKNIRRIATIISEDFDWSLII